MMRLDSIAIYYRIAKDLKSPDTSNRFDGTHKLNTILTFNFKNLSNYNILCSENSPCAILEHRILQKKTSLGCIKMPQGVV